jgi:hypothetical protein
VFSFPAVSFLCFYALMVPLHLLVSAAVLFLFSISSFSCFSVFPFYHNCNLVTITTITIVMAARTATRTTTLGRWVVSQFGSPFPNLRRAQYW